MRRFILKKKYPRSPQVGYIVEFDENNILLDLNDKVMDLTYEDCVENSEFWRELDASRGLRVFVLPVDIDYDEAYGFEVTSKKLKELSDLEQKEGKIQEDFLKILIKDFVISYDIYTFADMINNDTIYLDDAFIYVTNKL